MLQAAKDRDYYVREAADKSLQGMVLATWQAVVTSQCKKPIVDTFALLAEGILHYNPLVVVQAQATKEPGYRLLIEALTSQAREYGYPNCLLPGYTPVAA